MRMETFSESRPLVGLMEAGCPISQSASTLYIQGMSRLLVV